MMIAGDAFVGTEASPNSAGLKGGPIAGHDSAVSLAVSVEWGCFFAPS